jgi:hypothetical protein
MSEPAHPPGPNTPAFTDAIRQFREDIGDFRAIPQTLPRPSRTLPRLKLGPRYRSRLVAVLTVLILVAAGLLVGPRLSGPDAVPAELVGSWTTDDPRYRGRQLELTREALILRASIGERTEYTVRHVQRRQTAEGSAYVIIAHSETSGDYNLPLDYHKAQNTIALGTPARGLWYRAH